MRVLVIVLLAANALFFIWSRGWLDSLTGLPANGLREPQRLAAQQHPERIQPLAASAVAALQQRSCLEVGPFNDDAALAAAQAVLRAAGATVESRSQDAPPVWVVATIKLGDAEFRARKEATYKQLKIAFEPLAGLPAEQPAFVLSRHAGEDEAKTALDKLDKRGLKGLRVLALPVGSARQSLVIPKADGLLAAKLKASGDPALAGLRACGAASAAD